tara:strand:+ start:512 stop:703 length:192 start_codon:yes stop_codon:yes gene_type:complete
METRVRKLETEVAVLGNRQDTLEVEVTSIREDIQGINKQIATAQGLIIATVVIMQCIAFLMER